MQNARHPKRPHTLDYVQRILTDFQEIHGDRLFGDDAAIVCGSPNTATPQFSACMAGKLPLARVSVQHRLVVHDSLFIVLPAFALVLIGMLIKFRVRPAA